MPQLTNGIVTLPASVLECAGFKRNQAIVITAHEGLIRIEGTQSQTLIAKRVRANMIAQGIDPDDMRAMAGPKAQRTGNIV